MEIDASLVQQVNDIVDMKTKAGQRNKKERKGKEKENKAEVRNRGAADVFKDGNKKSQSTVHVHRSNCLCLSSTRYKILKDNSWQICIGSDINRGHATQLQDYRSKPTHDNQSNGIHQLIIPTT